MLIQEMIKNQEKQTKEIINKENKTFNEIFEILEFYVFNYEKIEDKTILNNNVQKLSSYLLNNIDELKEKMFQSCLKDKNNHENINRLELIIKFLPKEVDKSILIEVKDILEEDFERVTEPMPIEK